MYDRLFKSINHHSIILTPNHRLSTQLKSAYAKWQSHSCWEPLAVFPLKNWLNTLAGPLKASTEKMLSQLQIDSLWEKIIQEDVNTNAFNQIQTAKEAQTAWQLLEEWQLSTNDLPDYHSDELTTFRHWLSIFSTTLSNKRWLTSTQLHSRILATNTVLSVPQKIILFGFDELPPLYQSIINKIKKTSEVINLNIEKKPKFTRKTSLKNETKEISAMATWAEDYRKKHPNKKIACVIPKLTELYQPLLRAFTKACSNSSNNTTQPFNISAGMPLAAYPIIQVALQAISLHCHSKNIELDQITTLMHSPYLHASQAENQSAFLLTQYLTKHNPSIISKAVLSHAILSKKQQDSLSKKWGAYLINSANRQPKKALADWINDWQSSLAQLGWPGHHSIPSDTYQTIARWQKALIELTELDCIQATLSFEQALKILHQQLNQIVFQPKTQGEPAIEVLGSLEAAGMHFDAMWIMGMDAETWPSPAKPNAFLPKAWQRQLNMPHSSAEREYHFAKQLTNRLLTSAEEIIASHAEQKGDCELLASPLIKHLPSLNNAELIPTAKKTSTSNLLTLESYEDTQAMKIQAKETISGGSKILQLQSNCPFSAFASIRLNAKTIEKNPPGPSPLTRGILVHACLASLWQSIKNQEQLLDYKDDDLKALIEKTTWQHINENLFFKKISQRKLIEIEQQRLATLLFKWLKHETTRDSFQVIATELSYKTQLSGIPMKLTIDRIDQLQSGETVIIDYKTGKTNIKDWLSDRPKEPQLPLYAVTYDKLPVAIAYANIHASKVSLSGLIEQGNKEKEFKDIQKVTEFNSWDTLTNNWRQTLNKLADNFAQGDATVDPKNPTDSCKYCQLHRLCRIEQS